LLLLEESFVVVNNANWRLTVCAHCTEIILQSRSPFKLSLAP
jgi:hypothetical protein